VVTAQPVIALACLLCAAISLYRLSAGTPNASGKTALLKKHASLSFQMLAHALTAQPLPHSCHLLAEPVHSADSPLLGGVHIIQLALRGPSAGFITRTAVPQGAA
jgi:hypothetical protein